MEREEDGGMETLQMVASRTSDRLVLLCSLSKLECATIVLASIITVNYNVVMRWVDTMSGIELAVNLNFHNAIICSG